MRVPTQEVGVPTYQYACTDSACGHRFEAVQSFSDDPIAICPVCEGQVRKVFSAVGVVFKGSGFYRTDSRSGSANGDGSDSKSADKKANAETKSDEKKPVSTGATGSNGSSKDKQPVSSGTSSTGQKGASS